MASPPERLDPLELEAAFSMFAEASRQLSSSYADLQQQVGFLTDQLELANGKLKQQLDEKGALFRRLSALLEQLPGGVVELGAGGEVSSLNRAARAMLPNLHPGDSWNEWQQLHLESTEEMDLKRFLRDGKEVWFSVVTNPVPEEDCSLVLIHDMTEFHQMQHALARNERLVAMGEMSAGLAHQLRTPLAAAMLYAGHLSKAGLGEQDRLRVAGKIQNRLQHLEVLIQNMLRFVRGQQQQAEVLVFADVLAESLHHLAEAIAAAGVNLECRVEADDVCILVNRREMIGVIGNLIENALHVAFVGMPLRVRLWQKDGMACLSIADQGPGVLPEVLPRLFEPFFTTRKEGTGLGLAIVRNLVTAWGGDVSVENLPDHGAMFILRLPVV